MTPVFAIFVYLSELKRKLTYLLISFIASFLILLWHYETFLLISFLPQINEVPKRFISINITELFSSIILVSLFTCFLVLFNYIRVLFSLFFSSSWSYLQNKFFNLFFFIFWVNFVFVFVFLHLIVVPKVINFFLGWGLTDQYALLQINVESRVKNYLFWILQINFLLTNFFLVSFTFFFWAVAFLGPFVIYSILKSYKPQILFFVFCFLTFLIPFDTFSQLTFLLILLFFLELLTFLLMFSISYLTVK
uniref:Preprotein translocase subunit SecY n=1 Tax=Hildenbrandia rubra TaxID=31481 RepID=A0A0A7A722_9FLOR|nr:preprotein translocase subunit SecY [Hildenbrandia rubra]AHB62143.1 preprotein translocase subunit SecY [Hildenbrandia rubra]